MSQFLSPIVLEGRHVRLESLAYEHIEPLQRATADGELWKLWYTAVPTPDGVAAYVEEALAMQAEGRHCRSPCVRWHRAISWVAPGCVTPMR